MKFRNMLPLKTPPQRNIPSSSCIYSIAPQIRYFISIHPEPPVAELARRFFPSLDFPNMSLLFIFLFAVQALAFPSSLKSLPRSSESIARRAAPARSAILSALKLDHLSLWTTTLTVNGQKVTMMIDSGSADLYAFALIALWWLYRFSIDVV